MNIIHFQAQEKEIDIILIQGKFLSTPLQRVSENIEVITKKDIEASPARNIDELLQQFSGLDIQRRGPHGVQSDISLRGGTFGQVLILLNGIQMNDSQTAHNSLNIPIDLSSIERIEVIKGPAARRFLHLFSWSERHFREWRFPKSIPDQCRCIWRIPLQYRLRNQKCFLPRENSYPERKYRRTGRIFRKEIRGKWFLRKPYCCRTIRGNTNFCGECQLSPEV